MTTFGKMEARPVARLLDADNRELVGWLYLWESGEVNPLWINGRPIKAMILPLPGEDLTDLKLEDFDQR